MRPPRTRPHRPLMNQPDRTMIHQRQMRMSLRIANWAIAELARRPYATIQWWR